MTVKNAKKLIREFDQAKRAKLVKTKTCISCKKNKIEVLHDTGKHYPDPGKQDEGMWNDGTVGKFYGGFGSQHDMEGYTFGICDDCITELHDRGIIEYTKGIEREYHSEEFETQVERDMKLNELLDET